MNLHSIGNGPVPEDILLLHREWDWDKNGWPLRYHTRSGNVYYKTPWDAGWRHMNPATIAGWLRQARSYGHTWRDYTPIRQLEVLP